MTNPQFDRRSLLKVAGVFGAAASISVGVAACSPANTTATTPAGTTPKEQQ